MSEKLETLKQQILAEFKGSSIEEAVKKSLYSEDLGKDASEKYGLDQESAQLFHIATIKSSSTFGISLLGFLGK